MLNTYFLLFVLFFSSLLLQSAFSEPTKFRAMRSVGVEFIENKGQIADQFGKPISEILFKAEIKSKFYLIKIPSKKAAETKALQVVN